MKTIRFEKGDLDVIVEFLLVGNVVAFPTDTVYGLGVIYDDKEALQNLKQAKGRPENKPIPTMVSSFEQLKQVAVVDDRVKKIVENFMPGALTLILKKRSELADDITNGMNTIGVRMPDDEFLLNIIKKCEKPLFVTSANLSDHPSGLCDRDVLCQLDGRIDAIVMGQASGKTASTIIDITSNEIKILREGPISLRQILDCLA